MELWDIFDENRNPTGRLHERGKPLNPGDYHLVVHVWIQNSRGEYLISKRTPNKHFPNLWECTGGSALAGETSLQAALREVREELGIVLPPENGRLIRSDICREDFSDVWLFHHDADLKNVVLQEGETCGAKWAAKEDLLALRATGELVPVFDYLEWLFDQKASKDLPQE